MPALVPCPGCGLRLEPPARDAVDTARCPACDASLANLADLAPEAPADGPEPQICGRCKALVDMDAEGRCPRCKYAPPVEDDWTPCPTCGKRNPPDNDHCVDGCGPLHPIELCGGCGAALAEPVAHDHEAWCSDPCRLKVMAAGAPTRRAEKGKAWKRVFVAAGFCFAVGALVGVVVGPCLAIVLAIALLGPLRRATGRDYPMMLITSVVLLFVAALLGGVLGRVLAISPLELLR